MNKKDKKVPNEAPVRFFMPEFRIDPLQKAVREIEGVIFDSGLPFNMDYRPEDNYFRLELEDNKKPKTGTWIIDTDEDEHKYRTCSVCDYKERYTFSRGEVRNYCSCCGTRMTTCKM